jgi:hypothetical protein
LGKGRPPVLGRERREAGLCCDRRAWGRRSRHGRHQSASSPGPPPTHRAENGCGSSIDWTIFPYHLPRRTRTPHRPPRRRLRRQPLGLAGGHDNGCVGSRKPGEPSGNRQQTAEDDDSSPPKCIRLRPDEPRGADCHGHPTAP